MISACVLLACALFAQVAWRWREVLAVRALALRHILTAAAAPRGQPLHSPRALDRIVLDASDLGIARTDPGLLRGGDAARNAALLRATLGGQPTTPEDAERVLAIRDAVAINAAAALAVQAAARADAQGTAIDDRPLVDRVADQLPRARAVLAEGTALETLDAWAVLTQRLAG